MAEFEVKFYDHWTCSIRDHKLYIGFWNVDAQALDQKAFNCLRDLEKYIRALPESNIKNIFQSHYEFLDRFFTEMQQLGMK